MYDLAGTETSAPNAPDADGPYRFVKAAVRRAAPTAGGVRIEITSAIDPTLGLGSSAAVTIAVLAALEGRVTDNLHAKALQIIREIQGRGSGADLAASLWGGVQSYQITGDGPAQVTPLPTPPQLSLFNVGYKTPTADVLAKVAAAHAADPETFDAIYQEMGAVAAETIAVAATEGWEGTGHLNARYQKLMSDLGVSDHAIDAAIAKAHTTKGVISAKISGSGLGDCVVAMGTVPQGFVPVTLAEKGVVFYDAC